MARVSAALDYLLLAKLSLAAIRAIVTSVRHLLPRLEEVRAAVGRCAVMFS